MHLVFQETDKLASLLLCPTSKEQQFLWFHTLANALSRIYLVWKLLVCGCFVCRCLCTMCAVPAEAREGIRSPRTGITADCELPRGCWELNLSPLGEPPLQPLSCVFASVFMKAKGNEVLFSSNMFIWFRQQGNTDVAEQVTESFFTFIFCKEWRQLCMTYCLHSRIYLPQIWTWYFLFSKVIHYWLDLFNRLRPIKLIHFLGEFRWVMYFKEQVHSILVVKSGAIESFILYLYYIFKVYGILNHH